ncbi:hypothetical protein H0H93_014362, partial [Arthromyces matolae]
FTLAPRFPRLTPLSERTFLAFFVTTTSSPAEPVTLFVMFENGRLSVETASGTSEGVTLDVLGTDGGRFDVPGTDGESRLL